MFRESRHGFFSVALLPLGVGLAIYGAPTPEPAQPVGPVSYAQQIAPIFVEQCSDCHGAEEAEAGLVLTTYAGTMAGSEYGPVIEAGDPGASLLLEMIVAGEMPQEADPMEAEQIELVRTWISEGAADN